MTELDVQVDMANVELHKTIMCGECMTAMDEVKPKNFICPQCGRSYITK